MSLLKVQINVAGPIPKSRRCVDLCLHHLAWTNPGLPHLYLGQEPARPPRWTFSCPSIHSEHQPENSQIHPPPGIRACHCAKGTCSLLPQTGPAASWTHSRDALFSGALLMQNHGPLRHPSSWPLCIKENQGLEKR